jgi:hypothetical protein
MDHEPLRVPTQQDYIVDQLGGDDSPKQTSESVYKTVRRISGNERQDALSQVKRHLIKVHGASAAMTLMRTMSAIDFVKIFDKIKGNESTDDGGVLSLPPMNPYEK